MRMTLLQAEVASRLMLLLVDLGVVDKDMYIRYEKKMLKRWGF